MVNVSSLIQGLPPSKTIKVAELAAELKAQGKDILQFNMGEPDFSTPNHVIDAAKKALDEGFTHYTPSVGIPEFREAIAGKCIRENGIECTASDILVSSLKHVIYSSILAMVERGDEILIPDPAWVSYAPMVLMAGGKPIFIPTIPEEMFRLPPGSVSEAITDRTKLLIINTPSNPTGGVFPKEDLKGICDLAIDHDFFVLTDEVYEKLVFEGEHHSIGSFDGMFERTLTTSGLSKSYAMTGWRLGWLCATGNLLKEVNKVQQHTVTCATSFAQVGGVAALTGPQEPVKEMIEEFNRRRSVMTEGLGAIEGINYTPSPGTFYAFFGYENDMDSEAFCKYLLNEVGVSLTPGSAFGDMGEGYIRLSFAASQEKLKEGIRRIGEAVGRLR